MRQLISALFTLTLLAVGMGMVGACSTPQAGASNDAGNTILTYPAGQATPTVGRPAPALAAPALKAQDVLESWQVVDLPAGLPGEVGRWITRDGYLAQDGIQPAANLSSRTTMLLSPLPATEISAAFYDQHNGTAGLISNAGDHGFYRLLLDRGTGTFSLERVVDGVATVLAGGTAVVGEDTWHTMQLSGGGNTLIVRLDGRELARITDAKPLPAGKVGIMTRALGGIMFDQISLTEEN
ncbi:MAG: hypothetical protein HC822_02705 [Oscillochloris sp.]|nr:hypothetical protein [Oscillochloris sp.]